MNGTDFGIRTGGTGDRLNVGARGSRCQRWFPGFWLKHQHLVWGDRTWHWWTGLEQRGKSSVWGVISLELSWVKSGIPSTFPLVSVLFTLTIIWHSCFTLPLPNFFQSFKLLCYYMHLFFALPSVWFAFLLPSPFPHHSLPVYLASEGLLRCHGSCEAFVSHLQMTALTSLFCFSAPCSSP